MLYTEILNKTKDFVFVYRKGRSIVSKYDLLYVSPNGKP